MTRKISKPGRCGGCTACSSAATATTATTAKTGRAKGRTKGRTEGQTQFSGYGERTIANHTLPNMTVPSVTKAHGKGTQGEVTSLLEESRRDLEIAKTARSKREAFSAYISAERLFGIAAYLAGSRYHDLLKKHAARLAPVYFALLARMSGKE